MGRLVVKEPAADPSKSVVGRERELAAIERLLADARERFSALLLEGEPGIGKTTVFGQALLRAEAEGFQILACRPSASEAVLSLAAVGDLLDAVPAALWGGLPAPQRRALDVALLRAEPDELPVDHRAIAAGFRSLVTGIAAERPVLLAIDDIQWLDAASAAILEFVVRRLGPEPIGVLATRRPAEATGLDIVALTPADTLARERLGPLSLGALQRTLGERLGIALPRSLLARVHAASHGNPLFALEIGRLLGEKGRTSAGEPLPVPDDIRELVRGRVAVLPAATRDLLLAAALLARPTVETLGKAFDDPLQALLEPAERAAIAGRDGEIVVFAHPLHAAAVIAIATAAERRRMHLRLAHAAQGLEERARHAGLGTDSPEAAIANLLEDGAAAARARGGLQAAAELLERARTLTPSSEVDAARARGIRAAELHVHAGDGDRARMLLRELLTEPLAASQRGEALRLLAELSYSEEDLPESQRLLVEAVTIDDDPRGSALALLDLMYVTTQRMDFATAAQLGERALEDLRGSEDGPLFAEALAYSAMADYLSGRGADWGRIERALALEDPGRIAPIGLPVGAVAGLLLLYVDRHAEARELLEAVRKRLAERGDERDLAPVLLWLSWLETRCGNFDAAERLADEAITFAALTGNHSIRRWAIGQRAFVHAHKGEIAEARRRAAEAGPLDERAVAQIGLWVAASLALAELSVVDPDAAWYACRPLTEAVEQIGVVEPGWLFFLPDALEALIALEQLDRVEALLDAFEGRGRELDRAWVLATGGRCRGLLLAARGDLAGALAALDRALVAHDRLEMPFERARTLLVRGVTERRMRHRTAARRALEEAASEFERMGTRRWAERARAELDRLSGRRPRGEGELTPSERRAVELAVEGLSNKEIAARLVVTVHTVEVHLSHAYAKLGIRSRRQLARRLAGLDELAAKDEPAAKD